MDQYAVSRSAAAAAARVKEAADPATATATSVGTATESAHYAVGKRTLTTIKTLVAYACVRPVRTFLGFLAAIAMLFVKFGRSILDLARALICWLRFKLRFPAAHGRTDVRARRADEHGQRRRYAEEIARMPTRRVSEPLLRLRY